MKNETAVALGRLGGKATLKRLGKKRLAALGKLGGKARAAALSPERRREIALKAAAAATAKRAERREEERVKLSEAQQTPINTEPTIDKFEKARQEYKRFMTENGIGNQQPQTQPAPVPPAPVQHYYQPAYHRNPLLEP